MWQCRNWKAETHGRDARATTFGPALWQFSPDFPLHICRSHGASMAQVGKRGNALFFTTDYADGTDVGLAAKMRRRHKKTAFATRNAQSSRNFAAHKGRKEKNPNPRQFFVCARPALQYDANNNWKSVMPCNMGNRLRNDSGTTGPQED